MDKKVAILIIGIVLVVVIIGGNLIAKNMKKNVGQTNETQTEIENEFSQTFEDGTKLNTSTKLKEVKKLDNLEIADIQITNKDGKTVLLSNVTNKGTTKTEVTLLDIVLYDKSGKEIATIPGVISPLEPGKSTQLNTTTQEDYTNIYDFKIVKK